MKMKKFWSVILVGTLVVHMCCLPAVAMEKGNTEETFCQETFSVMRSTGNFSMAVSGNTTTYAASSFPLEIGESVKIKATYSPYYAEVAFGLVAPDGKFYGLDGEDGSFNESIIVDQRGEYILAIRNRSSVEISVSGYVIY